METLKKITFRFLLCILFLSANSYSFSENIRDVQMYKKWDFNFQNCNLDRAFKMISDKTGVVFFTNGYTENKVLNKSYQDKTLEEIIDDLLKETSYSVLWRYSDNILISAGIWIFAENIKPGEFRERNDLVVNKNETNIRRNRTGLLYNSDEKDENGIDAGFKNTAGDESALNKYASAESNKYGFSKNNLVTREIRNKRTAIIKRNIKMKSAVNTGNSGRITPYPQVPPIPEKFKNLEPPPMPPDFDYKGEF